MRPRAEKGMASNKVIEFWTVNVARFNRKAACYLHDAADRNLIGTMPREVEARRVEEENFAPLRGIFLSWQSVGASGPWRKEPGCVLRRKVEHFVTDKTTEE